MFSAQVFQPSTTSLWIGVPYQSQAIPITPHTASTYFSERALTDWCSVDPGRRHPAKGHDTSGAARSSGGHGRGHGIFVQERRGAPRPEERELSRHSRLAGEGRLSGLCPFIDCILRPHFVDNFRFFSLPLEAQCLGLVLFFECHFFLHFSKDVFLYTHLRDVSLLVFQYRGLADLAAKNGVNPHTYDVRRSRILGFRTRTTRFPPGPAAQCPATSGVERWCTW